MTGDVRAPARSSRPAAGVAAARPPWSGRRVVLGVTGGIAAYKSIQLARDLARYGAAVDVVMTRAARQFVGAISFEAVTGRAVLSDMLGEGHALDHIRLAREADIVCVVPATADFVARAATGRADDLLAAILLATKAPVLVCPAMNDGMWSHPQTQANVARLSALGYRVVGPAEGPLAFGEGTGPGRVEEPEVVLEHIGRVLGTTEPWRGRRVLVTAGPTREALDAVRLLTNRSSGRMGFAIAAAAWRRGADVTVVAGAVTVAPPVGVRVVRVESAQEMADAVRAELPAAHLLVMAAAVADFRPARRVAGKPVKRSASDSIALVATPDVLQTTRGTRPAGMVAVGFALETGDGREAARAKLAAKDLDLIVLNHADVPDAGFDVDTNRIVIIGRDGAEEALPLLSKDDAADALLDRIAPLLEARP
jgi:phosphopantothenoylcysteine decarboxylase/phosphopantothenate--cysteine ligase